ncbi:formate hydrogenlyase [bacterium CG2_30_37_16]|nr:MAG: formate hydrogenlyase [bacterium CG2_30_37_16]PIP30793.1 MAG: formate hydrogenlyase [bacterium (Candidatus Howlettbacteria) CG23_combo_of_CG06-09_8_20_14_all_37_9]PIX98717.1 MAG: formate hydrogenlyase [bacterium (Candidatus Howlettbacteria) CG_4_10_14_3_um_filter_37_10]PJB06804.1 MAG: formate hydrogenlyase [bacterium (Candidatus Howlettbacteria) CG_4_9_14_3_um_filter_37_10]
MITFFAWIIQIILVPVLSPLFVGIIRKIKARFQNRKGASIFQPYRDLRKLFGKDEVISKDASWIFKYMPFILFGTTLIVGLSLPMFTTFLKTNLTGDFLVVIYLLAFGTFFLALAGIDAGSAFGGFGSSREMTISALAEGGLIFSMLTLAIVAHSTNLNQIAISISSLPLRSFMPIILSFIGFFIALLAETGRFPFDNPATHLELTMIHEAMILEYSGKRLAVIEWAAANKQLIFLALGANLFFPWGIANSLSITAVFAGIIIFLIKLLILSVSIAVLESGMAKYRFFRLPDLLFTSFIISVIAIGIII